MRFFTNENKDEDPDTGKDVDVQDRGTPQADEPAAVPAHVTSDPVAVPQQRGPSPWSSTPDAADDGTGTHRREDFTPPDHAVADTTPPAGDATPSSSDATRPAGDAAPSSGDAADGVLKDDGGFDDPKAVDPATRTPLDDPAPTPADPALTDDGGPASGDRDAVLKDEGGFDDPKAVDPGTQEPLTESPADQAVAAAGTTTESKPGEVTAPTVASIFGDDDAKRFQERWRDVQLRFVDSPKEATAEAAGLVDEAVEKLSAALRGQKDQFGGASDDDTEKLRVELRGYREILNRIIAL